MTTKNLANNEEETKVYNQTSEAEATQVINEATSEKTENAEDTEDTEINPAAPISSKAAKRSPWAGRLGFAAAGAAAGFAAGYATSAAAATPSGTAKGLAPAAAEDSVASDRETVPSDEELDKMTGANTTQPTEEPATENETVAENIQAAARETAQTYHATSNPANNGHIISDDNIATGTVHTDAATSTAAAATSTTDSASTIAAGITDTTAAGTHAVENIATALHGGDATVDATVEVSIEEPVATTDDQLILANENGVRVAYVDDDMSFGEAFASAREQVGAPGVFTWHGNTYGTYYAEEWNNMSQDERAEFVHNAYIPENATADAPVNDDFALEVHEITATLNEDGTQTYTAQMTVSSGDEQVQLEMHDTDGDGTMDIAYVDLDNDGQADIAVSLEDENVTVDDLAANIHNNNEMAARSVEEPQLEVHEVSATMHADGSITSTADMTITHDGESIDVQMHDVDGDGTMDIAYVDLDGDGQADVAVSLENQDITIDDLAANIQNMDAEMPGNDDMAMTDFDSDCNPDF